MKRLNNFIIPIITLLILPIITSILNLFGIYQTKLINTIIYLIVILINGIIYGKNIDSKAYQKGLILGIELTLIHLLLSLFKPKYNLYTIVYYLLIILLSIVGSVIGINNKKRTK